MPPKIHGKEMKVQITKLSVNAFIEEKRENQNI